MTLSIYDASLTYWYFSMSVFWIEQVLYCSIYLKALANIPLNAAVFSDIPFPYHPRYGDNQKKIPAFLQTHQLCALVGRKGEREGKTGIESEVTEYHCHEAPS